MPRNGKSASPARELSPNTVVVKVCDGDESWPPYSYRLPQSPSDATPQGYTWRLLAEILKQTPYRLEVDVLPWARCLRSVESGNHAFTINASYSAERAQKFIYSEPYVFSHIHYFYSASRYVLPPIKSTADLQTKRNCGINGHNYALVGLRTEQVDRGADNFQAVFAKIIRDRCDIFTHSIEDIAGQDLLGSRLLDTPELAHLPVPGVPAIGRHFIFSKRHQHSRMVLPLLNAGIARLHKENRLSGLLDEETTLLHQRMAKQKANE